MLRSMSDWVDPFRSLGSIQKKTPPRSNIVTLLPVVTRMSTASDFFTDLQLPETLKSQSNYFRPKDEIKVHVKRIVSDLEYVLCELKTVVVDMRKMADQIDLVTSRVDRYYGDCAVDQLHRHGDARKDSNGVVEAKSRDVRTRSRASIDQSLISSSTRTRTRPAGDDLHIIPNLCGLLQSQRRQGNHYRCPNSRETTPMSREITEASRDDVIESEEGAVKAASEALDRNSLRAEGVEVERSLPCSLRTEDGDQQSAACICLCDTSSSSQDTGYCGLYEKELDERLELDATDLCLLTPEGRRPWALDWYGDASARSSIESVRCHEAVPDEDYYDDNDDDADDSVSDDDDDDYRDALKCEKTFPSRIMISKMRNCRWRAVIEP